MTMIRRFFDADRRQFARNVSLLQVATAVTLGMSLVQSIVLARTLGPAGLGIVVPVVALVRMISQFCEAGSANVIIVFGSRYRAAGDGLRYAAVIKAALVMTLASGAAAAVLSGLALAVLYQLGWSDGATLGAASWVAAAALVAGGEALVPAILRPLGRFGMDSAVRIGLTLASLTIISGTALVSGGNPTSVIVAYAVADLVLAAAGWAFVVGLLARDEGVRVHSAPLASLSRDWKEIRHYSVLTWFSSSSLLAFGRADEFIASFVAPAYDIGLYKVAKNGAFALIALSEAILDTAYVEIAKLWAAGATDQLRRLIRTVTLGGGAFALVAGAGVVLFGRPMIGVLYGPTFAGAFSLLLIQMLCSTLYVPGLWMIPFMRSAGRLRALVACEVVASAASFAGMVVLGAAWGITGVAVGRVLFTAVLILGGSLYIARFRRELFSARQPADVALPTGLRAEPT